MPALAARTTDADGEPPFGELGAGSFDGLLDCAGMDRGFRHCVAFVEVVVNDGGDEVGDFGYLLGLMVDEVLGDLIRSPATVAVESETRTTMSLSVCPLPRCRNST